MEQENKKSGFFRKAALVWGLVGLTIAAFIMLNQNEV